VTTFRAMGCDVVVAGGDAGPVAELFEAREAIFSRFRDGSELNRVNAAQSDPVLVSETFARTIETALGAARASNGLVTPTVGAAVVAAGYDRDFGALGDDPRPARDAAVPSWRQIRVASRWLFRTGRMQLDLNGVVKGATVDDALALLSRGGTVSAGGDVATTRPVVVEVPGGEAVTLGAGGLATSGTDRRTWRRAGVLQHHLIDPATGRPARTPWLQVTVAAGSCLAADVGAKAALLLGQAGPSWLDRRGLAGRFVAHEGNIVENATWAIKSARRVA
jgi:thiamine biosynthesis lipoprotein